MKEELTLEEALGLVHKYWQQPPGSDTLESARLGHLMHRILTELPFGQWEPLRFRLTGKRSKQQLKLGKAGGDYDGGIVNQLTHAIDRRGRQRPPSAA